ncbi:AAA+ family ATPase [Actibacterium sp. XHP0104]|uniref:AAA+ family ATPase n=1 Tax=Actibacterium sp. XHP0104 TaxID=2984335 RepID=UPI0021E8E678|nr:AAA+ family ATPase [Actibacterium sp. XHP0104]MCV2880624.1 AAA+ family ATPase [Actibacterium sp. XHP0104]
MKQIAILCVAAILALSPAQAETVDGKGDMDEGLSLLEEGARLLLKGLAEEMEPALEDLTQKLQPAVVELLRLIDDFDAYHMPERLPNGDIIIRRKDPLPLPEPGEGGEIEI